MKVTIAQLQERIKYLEDQKNEWYQKYRELKDAEDKRNEMDRMLRGERYEQVDRQITNLMEIIRWQIRPNTAESPFKPTKSERNDGERY